MRAAHPRKVRPSDLSDLSDLSDKSDKSDCRGGRNLNFI